MYNIPDNFNHDRDMVYEPYEHMMELVNDPGDNIQDMSILERWLHEEFIKYSK